MILNKAQAGLANEFPSGFRRGPNSQQEGQVRFLRSDAPRYNQARQLALLILVGFLGFVFICGRASCATAPQQTQELKGKVVDQNKAPISGVDCVLQGGLLPSQGTTVTTGSDGGFSIRGLLPGAYVLTCTALGYEPYVATGIEVTSSEAPNLQAVMPSQKKLVQKVEVSAQAGTVAQQTSEPPSKLGSEELTTLPIAEQKFKAFLPLTPGVIQTVKGTVNIKGTEENQGMLLIDGAQAVDPITGSYDVDLSIDAIQSLNVYKAPLDAQYGGFSGGLTTIETKAPANQWGWDVNDFFPGFRGRSGHLVGINDWEPRVSFTGPLSKNLSFSEYLNYSVMKIPIRGLAWPHNETKKESWNSLTTLQYVFSPHHLASFAFHLFPSKQEFADISALIAQPNSSNYSERGYSLQVNDSYQFKSGAILNSFFKFMEFDADAHGQGTETMLLTPDGYGGNYFNSWRRTSDQEEGNLNYRFPSWRWLGKHEFETGGDFIYHSYHGQSQSRPVLITREDGTVAGEINFLGPGGIPTSQTPAFLFTNNAEGAAYIGDHWMMNDHAAVDLGFRYYGQAVGAIASFSPRLGIVYSPGSGGRNILRAGVGIFKSRIPLLASDFGNNPTRLTTFFDQQGNILGPTTTYVNRCATRAQTGLNLVPDCSDLDATPYNLTWNMEFDRQLTPHFAIRGSYLQSNIYREFVISPEQTNPTQAMMLLSNRGASRYHEFEAMVSYRDEKGNKLNASYVRSRTLGNLNTVADVFVPFEQPVIHPDFSTSLNADVPDRFIAWGIFHLPLKFTFAPVIDWRTGFPWSKINDFQNYVGTPNSNRFPPFFSFDFKVWKWLPLPGFLPYGLGKQRLRWGIGFHNATNALDPLEIYNNIASPNFGHFVGYQHRVIDINVDAGD